MENKEKEYAPGMRVIIRDEEWIIKQVIHNSLDDLVLFCQGTSISVKNKEVFFLTDMEKIEHVKPEKTQLVVDTTPQYAAGVLFMESLWRQKLFFGPTLRMGTRAAMDLMPFQLEPARLALSRVRQRILIADAVGLGKTLEAGILMSELIHRGKGRRILVVTVKSMMAQFQKEMWNRFTIPLIRLDSSRIQRIRENISFAANPFFYYDKTIISIDTLKRDAEYRSHLENAHWDIIVIDEAQNVADRSGNWHWLLDPINKTNSKRSKLAKLLAERSDTLIMLSATPHDGRAESFASLMQMLDPTQIIDPSHYSREEIKGLFVRRFKKDVKDQITSAFKERNVETLECDASPAEEAAFDFFTEMQLKMDLKKTKGMGQLFKTTLEKALFSSPAACVKSINERLARLRKKYSDGQISDIQKLETLRDLALKIGPKDFSRYQRLLELLRGNDYKWDPKVEDDRLVIFTERIETMKFLAENLQKDLHLPKDAVRTISGSDRDCDLLKLVEEFGQNNSPVRVIVASDVASEGLNLHYLCHRIIHFDIPWSLMVFQQRNGRIDRYGQQKSPDIRYFWIRSKNKKILGDARTLRILIAKEQQASENIGDPTLLMGKFNIDEEEKIVASAIENETSAEDFSNQLDKTLEEFDPFEALMRAGNVSTTPEPAETQLEPTLFTDADFLYKSLELHKVPVERFTQKTGLRVTLTPELEGRLKAMMPEEALPRNAAKDRKFLSLSDDKEFCMEEMRMSHQNNLDESAWPKTQFLWPLHPLFTWVHDQNRLLFKRGEAPLIDSPNLAKNETMFLMAGTIPNQRSEPLVDEWFGLLYRDGRFVKEYAMRDAISFCGVKAEMINTLSLTQEAAQKASLLVPDAVARARKILTAAFKRYEATTKPQIEAERASLEEWKKFQEGITKKMTDERQKEENERRIQKAFARFDEWVEKAMTIDDEPYIRFVGAVTGK